MKEELVSIILVNWNGKKWLKKCLTTLSNQTYKKIEIMLVDNSSKDGSVEYIKKSFPKVKIIQNKINLGYPTANNIGVKESEGKYLLMINVDTWVKKDFVADLFRHYKENSYAIISPLERFYNGNIEINNTPTIDPTGSPAYFFEPNRTDKLFFMSTGYFCSKDNYIKTLGFDSDYFAYYEDVDWFWRMTLLKQKFGFAKDIFIYHAGAGSTGKGIKYNMFLWRNQNALQSLLKNYSSVSLLIILPIYILQNIVEIVFFLVTLNPKIAYSYLEGWWFNIKHLSRTLKKRQWVQKHRKVNDIEILKKMYLGPAKLRMLLNY
jgi:GT2 family glycosyltransferase